LARKDNPHFLDIVADVFCFGIEDMLDWVNDELKRQLESLAYLGPLRSYPPRHLVGMQDREPNWFSGGGHAWDTLRRDPAVLDQVNRWLGNPDFASVGYELRLRNLTDLTRIGEGARRRLAYRVRQADTATEADVDVTVDALLDDLASDPAATALGEIRLLDRRTQTEVSHRDVGIGISQVVPVLVHAYANRNQTVLIEQPEIHLHPKLQADLGDVFIEAALAEAGPHHTFLIETHSEHLILRILRRVRESCAGNPCDPPPPDGKDPPKVEIRPEDVCVLYVLPKPTGAQVIELPVTEEGDFTANWPGGFFTDRARELF
jgi:hypothetical protein